MTSLVVHGTILALIGMITHGLEAEDEVNMRVQSHDWRDRISRIKAPADSRRMDTNGLISIANEEAETPPGQDSFLPDSERGNLHVNFDEDYDYPDNPGKTDSGGDGTVDEDYYDYYDDEKATPNSNNPPNGVDMKEEVYQWSLENSVPGIPGTDYPVYGTVPRTGFQCKDFADPGFYGDVNAQCQVFHICQEDGRQDSFLCPVGTVFNQMHFVCDWWFKFNCSDTMKYFSLNTLLYKGKETPDMRKRETSNAPSLGDMKRRVSKMRRVQRQHKMQPNIQVSQNAQNFKSPKIPTQNRKNDRFQNEKGMIIHDSESVEVSPIGKERTTGKGHVTVLRKKSSFNEFPQSLKMNNFVQSVENLNPSSSTSMSDKERDSKGQYEIGDKDMTSTSVVEYVDEGKFLHGQHQALTATKKSLGGIKGDTKDFDGHKIAITSNESAERGNDNPVAAIFEKRAKDDLSDVTQKYQPSTVSEIFGTTPVFTTTANLPNRGINEQVNTLRKTTTSVMQSTHDMNIHFQGREANTEIYGADSMKDNPLKELLESDTNATTKNDSIVSGKANRLRHWKDGEEISGPAMLSLDPEEITIQSRPNLDGTLSSNKTERFQIPTKTAMGNNTWMVWKTLKEGRMRRKTKFGNGNNRRRFMKMKEQTGTHSTISKNVMIRRFHRRHFNKSNSKSGVKWVMPPTKVFRRRTNQDKNPNIFNAARPKSEELSANTEIIPKKTSDEITNIKISGGLGGSDSKRYGVTTRTNKQEEIKDEEAGEPIKPTHDFSAQSVMKTLDTEINNDDIHFPTDTTLSSFKMESNNSVTFVKDTFQDEEKSQQGSDVNEETRHHQLECNATCIDALVHAMKNNHENAENVLREKGNPTAFRKSILNSFTTKYSGQDDQISGHHALPNLTLNIPSIIKLNCKKYINRESQLEGWSVIIDTGAMTKEKTVQQWPCNIFEETYDYNGEHSKRGNSLMKFPNDEGHSMGNQSSGKYTNNTEYIGVPTTDEIRRHISYKKSASEEQQNMSRSFAFRDENASERNLFTIPPSGKNNSYDKTFGNSDDAYNRNNDFNFQKYSNTNKDSESLRGDLIKVTEVGETQANEMESSYLGEQITPLSSEEKEIFSQNYMGGSTLLTPRPHKILTSSSESTEKLAEYKPLSFLSKVSAPSTGIAQSLRFFGNRNGKKLWLITSSSIVEPTSPPLEDQSNARYANRFEIEETSKETPISDQENETPGPFSKSKQTEFLSNQKNVIYPGLFNKTDSNFGVVNNFSDHRTDFLKQILLPTFKHDTLPSTPIFRGDVSANHEKNRDPKAYDQGLQRNGVSQQLRPSMQTNHFLNGPVTSSVSHIDESLLHPDEEKYSIDQNNFYFSSLIKDGSYTNYKNTNVNTLRSVSDGPRVLKDVKAKQKSFGDQELRRLLEIYESKLNITSEALKLINKNPPRGSDVEDVSVLSSKESEMKPVWHSGVRTGNERIWSSGSDKGESNGRTVMDNNAEKGEIWLSTEKWSANKDIENGNMRQDDIEKKLSRDPEIKHSWLPIKGDSAPNWPSRMKDGKTNWSLQAKDVALDWPSDSRKNKTKWMRDEKDIPVISSSVDRGHKGNQTSIDLPSKSDWSTDGRDGIPNWFLNDSENKPRWSLDDRNKNLDWSSDDRGSRSNWFLGHTDSKPDWTSGDKKRRPNWSLSDGGSQSPTPLNTKKQPNWSSDEDDNKSNWPQGFRPGNPSESLGTRSKAPTWMLNSEDNESPWISKTEKKEISWLSGTDDKTPVVKSSEPGWSEITKGDEESWLSGTRSKKPASMDAEFSHGDSKKPGPFPGQKDTSKWSLDSKDIKHTWPLNSQDSVSSWLSGKEGGSLSTEKGRISDWIIEENTKRWLSRDKSDEDLGIPDMKSKERGVLSNDRNSKKTPRSSLNTNKTAWSTYGVNTGKGWPMESNGASDSKAGWRTHVKDSAEQSNGAKGEWAQRRSGTVPWKEGEGANAKAEWSSGSRSSNKDFTTSNRNGQWDSKPELVWGDNDKKSWRIAGNIDRTLMHNISAMRFLKEQDWSMETSGRWPLGNRNPETGSTNAQPFAGDKQSSDSKGKHRFFRDGDVQEWRSDSRNNKGDEPNSFKNSKGDKFDESDKEKAFRSTVNRPRGSDWLNNSGNTKADSAIGPDIAQGDWAQDRSSQSGTWISNSEDSNKHWGTKTENDSKGWISMAPANTQKGTLLHSGDWSNKGTRNSWESLPLDSTRHRDARGSSPQDWNSRKTDAWDTGRKGQNDMNNSNSKGSWREGSHKKENIKWSTRIGDNGKLTNGWIPITGRPNLSWKGNNSENRDNISASNNWGHQSPSQGPWNSESSAVRKDRNEEDMLNVPKNIASIYPQESFNQFFRVPASLFSTARGYGTHTIDPGQQERVSFKGRIPKKITRRESPNKQEWSVPFVKGRMPSSGWIPILNIQNILRKSVDFKFKSNMTTTGSPPTSNLDSTKNIRSKISTNDSFESSVVGAKGSIYRDLNVTNSNSSFNTYPVITSNHEVNHANHTKKQALNGNLTIKVIPFSSIQKQLEEVLGMNDTAKNWRMHSATSIPPNAWVNKRDLLSRRISNLERNASSNIIFGSDSSRNQVFRAPRTHRGERFLPSNGNNAVTTTSEIYEPNISQPTEESFTLDTNHSGRAYHWNTFSATDGRYFGPGSKFSSHNLNRQFSDQLSSKQTSYEKNNPIQDEQITLQTESTPFIDENTFPHSGLQKRDESIANEETMRLGGEATLHASNTGKDASEILLRLRYELPQNIGGINGKKQIKEIHDVKIQDTGPGDQTTRYNIDDREKKFHRSRANGGEIVKIQAQDPRSVAKNLRINVNLNETNDFRGNQETYRESAFIMEERPLDNDKERNEKSSENHPTVISTDVKGYHQNVKTGKNRVRPFRQERNEANLDIPPQTIIWSRNGNNKDSFLHIKSEEIERIT